MKNLNKHLFILFTALVILTITAGNAYPQENAGQLFEKALYAEEVKGELAEAIGLYQQVVKENPGNRQVAARALLHIGICYEKMGLEQAQQAYRDVINKFSEQETEVALAKERINRLEAYTANLDNKAEEHIKRGAELFKRWEYEEAISEYEYAVKLRPNTLLALNARYCIGQSWFRAGNYVEALEIFKKLIEENPESNIAPVSELMMEQVKHAMENNKNPVQTKNGSDVNTLVDPETGINLKKTKSLTGESDIITYTTDLNLSLNGKFLLSGNMVVPMDGTAPFELIDFKSTRIQATRGTWSPDGKLAAFFSGDALCVVPVSSETGKATGPVKKINEVKLRWQSNPGWSPDSKKITYYAPDGNLWIISSDGNDLKQLTESEIREVGPAWSPDGKTIAFGTAGKTRIGLYETESGKYRELAETGYRCFPVWSPDGKWIVGNQFGKLHFYSLNNKSEYGFSPPDGAGYFFTWSKDGRRMLFFRSSYFSNTGLKIASPNGGPSFEPVPLLTNWGTARWSDDNKWIAVQGEDDSGGIAYSILPLTGGESFLVNLDNLVDGKPFPFAISSGLKKLIFGIKRDKSTEDLYAVPISAEEASVTGPAVKIFDGRNREGAYNIVFSLSPDGEKAALIQNGEIFVAFTNGTPPVSTGEKASYLKWTTDGMALLINGTGWNLLENPGPEGRIIKLLDEENEIDCRWPNIDVSPDRSRVAVLTDREIRIIPVGKTGNTQELDISHLELNHCNYLKWSPDGQHLAFAGVKETDDPASFPDGKSHIYKISVTDGSALRVAPDDDHIKSELSWSPDGKWLAYSVDKSVKVRPESIIWEADFEEVKEKLGMKY